MADVEHWCTGRRSWHSIPGRGGTGNGTPGLLIGNAYDSTATPSGRQTSTPPTPHPSDAAAASTPEKAEKAVKSRFQK